MMIKPRGMDTLCKSLITYRLLFDHKGNVITYNPKTYQFNFGVYKGREHLMIGRIWVKNKMR